MAYLEPVTSWVSANAPLPSDFNRIEGNTKQNHEDIVAEIAARIAADSDEADARAEADELLQEAISGEASTRAAADLALENSKQPMPAANTGNSNITNFPIGTTLAVATDGNRDRNVQRTIRLDAANDRYYLDWGTGAVLTGTWVNRGQISTAPDYRSLYQRVL